MKDEMKRLGTRKRDGTAETIRGAARCVQPATGERTRWLLAVLATMVDNIGSDYEALENWFVSRICGQRLAPVAFPVRDTERVR